MKKHINLEILGRVQGVGYRYSCMDAARKIGVKGFVQNKSDGSVYAEAEGDEEQLTQFRLWCRQGPSMAKVIEIIETEGEIKNFDSFRIERSGY
jgi:acylphosphatase